MKISEIKAAPTAQYQMGIWYRFIRFAARVLCVLLFRLKSSGGKNVPATGAWLVACNHVSFLDPPCVGIASARELHFFARKSLFNLWWLRWLIASLNSIPIDLGSADLAGVRQALRLLKDGEALLVFPEGTRSHDGNPRQPLPGVGMLVAKTGVSIVPVRIFGADKAWPRQSKFFRPGHPITVAIGKPFRFELTAEEAKSRETYQAISEEIMRRINELQLPVS